MAESMMDAMHNENNAYEYVYLQEDPFPPVDPFSSVNHFLQLILLHPLKLLLAKKTLGRVRKRRDGEFGELVSLIGGGLNGLSENSAVVKYLTVVIGKSDETKSQSPKWVERIGFLEVIGVVFKSGNRLDVLHIYRGMNEGLKRDSFRGYSMSRYI